MRPRVKAFTVGKNFGNLLLRINALPTYQARTEPTERVHCMACMLSVASINALIAL